jgi:UDP-N-acetyl-D-mannosaminuronate dehydrogenase
MQGLVLVIGLGEIGKPLLEILSEHYETVGVDLQPIELNKKVGIIHLCYPFEIENFVGQSVNYIEKYKPELTIVNSTVAPGTTRKIYEASGAAIAHSPIRGKHKMMKSELNHYIKYIGGIDQESARQASDHFQSANIKTKILSSPEATEITKLTETTYFGLLIAWAQEVERYCDEYSLNYDDVVSYYEEIKYLPPVKYFPGIIGGHCVMPNIKILKTVFDSDILEAIEHSNEMKIQRKP